MHAAREPVAPLPPSVRLADDVRALLWSLDPARHNGQPLNGTRAQILQETLDAVEAGMQGAEALRRALSIEPDTLGGWDKWRRHALPAYEAFAALVRESGHAAPSLRPSNHVRAVFHVMGGTSAAMMVEHVLPPSWLLPVAGLMATWAWSMELTRRRSQRVNRLLMWVFGPVAHAHEAWRINSATWFSTALVAVALIGSPLAALVGFLVLGWADPAAGIIGRRFGRTPLVHGRTLEGTLTFAIVGAAVSFAALWLWHPELTTQTALLLAAAGAIPAAVAELFARRIDDNLAIPIVAALGVVAASALI
jgi:dolichol kinase